MGGRQESRAHPTKSVDSRHMTATELEDYVAQPIVDRMVLLQPDDLVVFQCSARPITAEEAENVRDIIAAKAPELRFLVMGSDWGIPAILRQPV